MKKVLLAFALILGTSVMVNAQEPAKTTPAKEVKVVKHHKKTKTAQNGDVKKVEATTKTETKTATKK
jgi:hypothetical protein